MVWTQRRTIVSVILVTLILGVRTHAMAKDGDAGKPDDLKTLGFGVAVGFLWNVTGVDIVSDASVDANGIVRVDKRSNTSAGAMLEMHYFPKRWKSNTAGAGPFVGVRLASDQIIDAVGLGFMIGWKIGDTGSKGFGLGIGYAAIPTAKTLGHEFVEDHAAPLDPSGKPLPIRYEERDKGSVMMLLSFVF
jgi:hypothetical protein